MPDLRLELYSLVSPMQEIQNGFEVVTSTEHYLIQADTQEERYKRKSCNVHVLRECLTLTLAV